MDSRSSILIDDLFIAMLIFDNLSNEKFNCNGTGPVGNRFGHFCLQALSKRIITLTGNDSKDIDITHIVTEYIGIHPLATLINTKAQAPSNFLTLADITAALFQSTNLEHIRVIPSLPQGGMRKDKSYRRTRRITIQQ